MIKYWFKRTSCSKKLFVVFFYNQYATLTFIFTERVQADFLSKRSETSQLASTQLNIRSSFCITVQTINTAALSIGKDQKFELFICLGLRWVYLKIPSGCVIEVSFLKQCKVVWNLMPFDSSRNFEFWLFNYKQFYL